MLDVSPLRACLLLAILASSSVAFAQSGNKVPSPTDYTAFSRFVTDRNIFDPNRQPHVGSTQTRTKTRTRTTPSTPTFSLVGTISYEKGFFAFFNGNQADLKKALPVAETIAGYTIAEISQGRVTLTTTNKPEKLELKVGDMMRQESGKWVLSGIGELPADSSPAETTSASGDKEATTAATSSASEPNDILKRLKEKREKENQ